MRIHYRKLGKTNIKVSEVGFGCWAIGGNAYGKVHDKDSLEALNAAWDAGVNFYDTADIYGEGHSEALLGQFLKDKPRTDIVIASKVGWDFYGQGATRSVNQSSLAVQTDRPEQKSFCSNHDLSQKVNHAGHQKNFDPVYIRFACERSLKRLNMEALDLYQLHNPSLGLIQKKEILDVLEELKKQGKIRFIGISVHTVQDALAALEDDRVDVLQVIFNLLDQRMAEQVFPEAKKKNVGIMVREPLASGLLTGKYASHHEFPKNDHRRRWVREKREADWEKIQHLQRVLEGAKISLPRAALEYALKFDAVSAIIPGAKTRTQVLENVKASGEPLLGQHSFEDLKKAYYENEIFKQALNPR